MQQVFEDGDYELTRLSRYPEIQRYYDKCSSPLIIDAGANIGASAVWFAQAFPKATLTCIEPHPGNFELLQRNTAGLKVLNIHGALASRPGTLRLFDPGGGEWAFRTGEGNGPSLGEVPAHTLADLVRDEPFILKIDIEGGEADLFDSDAFALFPVVIVELHDWMLPRLGTSRNFLRWHLAQNRDFVHFGENVFSLCNRLLPEGEERNG